MANFAYLRIKFNVRFSAASEDKKGMRRQARQTIVCSLCLTGTTTSFLILRQDIVERMLNNIPTNGLKRTVGRDGANKRLPGESNTKLNIRYAVHPAPNDNILFYGRAGFSQICQNDYLIFIRNFGKLRISPRYAKYCKLPCGSPQGHTTGRTSDAIFESYIIFALYG